VGLCELEAWVAVAVAMMKLNLGDLGRTAVLGSMNLHQGEGSHVM